MNFVSSQVPLISVLIPAFNSERYLRDAVESIQRQTLQDWEMLLIHDPSEDRTVEICEELAQSDVRIRSVKNRFSRGIAAALNTGILESRAKFIARMDADDLAVPNRFAMQVDFLNSNPQVGVVGTYFEVFNDKGPRLVLRHPTNPIFNALFMCADSIIGHPTVMMRKEAIIMGGGYFESEPAEDFGLFARISRRWRVENIPVVGLRYREHTTNLSVTNRNKVVESAFRIGQQHYTELLGTADGHELLRTFILNPKALGRASRLRAVSIATKVCYRSAELYDVPFVSPLVADAMWSVTKLLQGRPFHG